MRSWAGAGRLELTPQHSDWRIAGRVINSRKSGIGRPSSLVPFNYLVQVKCIAAEFLRS